MAKKMWQFKTRNFTVRWLISPDVLNTDGLTASEAAEWKKNVRSRKWKCFQSDIEVVCNATGILLGHASIGNSVRANPAEFRDHFGVTALGCGSYFKQMVAAAVAEARERFPAHQAMLAQEVRKKQKVLGVSLRGRTKSKASISA